MIFAAVEHQAHVGLDPSIENLPRALSVQGVAVTAGQSAGEEAARQLRRAADLRRQADAAERRAAAFARGRRGEIAVAQILDSLHADGYRHLDDVRFPGSKRANVDHVLVGPAGVFIVDAKEWGGRVEVRDGVLRQNGYRRTDKLAVIVAAARAVEERAGLPARAIYPLACLTGVATIPPALVGDCTVVSLDALAAGLRAMPVRHTPEQVSGAFDRLQLVLESKSAERSTPAIVQRASRDARAYDARYRQGREPALPSAPVPVQTRTPAALTRRDLIFRGVIAFLIIDAVVTAALERDGQKAGGYAFAVLLAIWLAWLEARRRGHL